VSGVKQSIISKTYKSLERRNLFTCANHATSRGFETQTAYWAWILYVRVWKKNGKDYNRFSSNL